ncbi:MAG TPA: PDZ domain-containing protein [Kofleriaceae bacterium]|nr:PDZ domain-containing protein [Kofleriaceae bacterium]
MRWLLCLWLGLAACERADEIDKTHAEGDGQATSAMRSRGFMGVRYVFRDGVVEIVDVIPKTAAELAGIRAGDRVLAFDGTPVRTGDELMGRVAAAGRFHIATVTVERDGQVQPVLLLTRRWPAIDGQ